MAVRFFRDRLLPLIIISIYFILLFGVISFVLISQGLTLWALIPFALLIFLLFRMYQHYMQREKEYIEAEKQYTKGFWKLYLVFIFLAGLVSTTHSYFDLSQEDFAKYVTTILGFTFVIIIFVIFSIRHKKYHKEAKQKIAERKAREARNEQENS